MIKNYLWFAIKVNLLLFIITIIVGLLSGFLLFPIVLILGGIGSESLFIIVATLWLALLTILPYYWAFKSVYKRANLKLFEAIFFTLGIKIIIDVIYLYFAEEYLDPLPTIIYLLINAGITFIVFYFAGSRYQPATTHSEEHIGTPPTNQINM